MVASMEEHTGRSHASGVLPWLEEAGLGRHAEAFAGVDEETFRKLLMQDYGKFGVTAMEDKQTLFRLIKRINAAATVMNEASRVQEGLLLGMEISADSGRETAPANHSKVPPMIHPHLHQHLPAADTDVDGGGSFLDDGSSGLLDLNDHDGDLISPSHLDHHADDGIYSGMVSPEPEPEFLGPPSSRPQYLTQPGGVVAPQQQQPAAAASSGPQPQGPPSDPPKIRVVVRKRPLNRKEIERADADIIEVCDTTSLRVHEEKTKVDLCKYNVQHEFNFDDALDEGVSNDAVYQCTVQPLVGTLFRGGRATCFAYGQTGSGKTYTMSPLPIRAGREIIELLRDPERSEMRLHVSNFEIYGGKLYDLLNGRQKLTVLEDSKKQVNIVGLQEYVVTDPKVISDWIESGAACRSVGCTGANEDSSRSHSIVQFAIKRPSKKTAGGLVLVGKLSFIDLAGSERGADTFDNDRQTRLEGAEINKSLLALKECIRALDLDKGHVPFRGSKLTEVLRDSFVGKEARTVMIANISPNMSSVEHTLNTLRYADRVKELRKDKQDRAAGGVTPDAQGGYGRVAPPPPVYKSPAEKPAGLPLPPKPAAVPRAAEQGKVAEGTAGVVVDTRPAQDRAEEDGVPQISRDDLMSSILQEEDFLIAAHRQQIEETMELVRKEMNLLSEVDQPGSKIDTYVANLTAILKQKTEGTARLQRQLASFQQKLKEEEDMSRRMGSRR